MGEVDLLLSGAVNGVNKVNNETVQAMTFGERMRALMAERNMSLRSLAKTIHYDVGYLSKVSRDLKPASAELAGQLDTALGAGGALVTLALARRIPGTVDEGSARADDSDFDNEIHAIELSRRAAASDVGAETLLQLEGAVDDLAVAYPGTAPAELLRRVRRHLSYVAQLLDVKKTLAEHRRLIVVGGWLSLLAATCHTDLHQRPAARARLRTAARMAEHAEHAEIAAWCLETQAWQTLTDGDYRQAVTLSQGAQAIAPRNGSAYIQATAQEGRAWARLGAGQETHDALERLAQLIAPLPTPDRPEHHFRYDPAKGDGYAATTLSWLGDPAAEPYARRVLAHLESGADGPLRPRRTECARLDLSLALLAAKQPDEAAELTRAAVTSGVLVPSNYWRAAEVITAIEAQGLPEAADLREAYRGVCEVETVTDQAWPTIEQTPGPDDLP